MPRRLMTSNKPVEVTRYIGHGKNRKKVVDKRFVRKIVPAPGLSRWRVHGLRPYNGMDLGKGAGKKQPKQRTIRPSKPGFVARIRKLLK